MVKSKVKYIDKISYLMNHYNDATDYIIKLDYPIDYKIFEKLLELEMTNSNALNTTFAEFESLDVSGRHIINLSNNININILIKNVTDSQMEELLVSYIDTDMKKIVYPAKIIVLVSLYALYMRHFYDIDIFDKWDEIVSTVLNKFIYYTYIKDKYTFEFINEWSKWMLLHMIDTNRQFVDDFKHHCKYLFDVAYDYHSGNNNSKIEDCQYRIKSGLYVPLAFVMRDMKYNPYRAYPTDKKFDYAISIFKGMVINALAPTVDYSLLTERYINNNEKQPVHIDSIDGMSDSDILSVLKDGNYVITSNCKSKRDLFPIEVRSE